MGTTFGFWQELEPGSWIETMQGRLDGLTLAERTASLAFRTSVLDWRVQLEAAEGPLARVPLVVKDLFDVKGLPTTASSTFLGGRIRQAPKTAEFVRRLQEAGAILVGKSQLNEFAYGLSGENPHYGNCPHPFLEKRLCGGSSSGSAFLVGRGLVPLAAGTDTGGSIRVPASYGGLYGFRLEAGEWTEGCFPLAPRFDTVGCFTGAAEDLRAVLEVCGLGGWGERLLPDSGNGPLPQNWAEATESVDPFPEDLGGLLEAFIVLQSSAAYAVHAEWLDKEKRHYDPVVWQRIDRGRHWSESQKEAAEARTRDFAEAFRRRVKERGYLIFPAAPGGAPTPGEATEDLRRETLLYTVAASLSGLPALSVPLEGEALPRGIQVIVDPEASSF